MNDRPSKTCIGITRHGARLYRPDNTRQAAKGLVEIDYSDHKVWGLPWINRKAAERVTLVIYAICIFGLFILTQILRQS